MFSLLAEGLLNTNKFNYFNKLIKIEINISKGKLI